MKKCKVYFKMLFLKVLTLILKKIKKIYLEKFKYVIEHRSLCEQHLFLRNKSTIKLKLCNSGLFSFVKNLCLFVGILFLLKSKRCLTLISLVISILCCAIFSAKVHNICCR